MTNVMHKFLIYLSIYFRLTCFGLSISPSSEAGVQRRQRAGADTIPSWLKPLPKLYSASEDGLIESPKHVGQKEIDK
jgi:hypothetical protein